MLSKMSKLAFFLLLIGSVLLTGCGSQNKTSERSVNSNAEGKKKFVVVTSFYPVYIATINVTRDVPGVEVINMTKPQTGCLHDYQLTPEDLKTLERANAFVINGAGMEAFLDKTLQQQPQLKVIDASKDIPLLTDQTGEQNPHVWVSITNHILQVQNIAGQLATLDSANAGQYKKNAEEYNNRLAVLRDSLQKTVSGVSQRDIITFHEAFPYFAKEFNLTIVAVIEREPGTDPSPKELAETIETVKASRIKALFAEPQYSTKAAQTIARETGAKIYTLDPIVTGEAKPGAYDDYIRAMEKNAKTLREALQ
ncbi:MAG: metal transporter substrate-binding protein [Firmicutes bacterium]|nr:metal transporter substrate-binding protein [Bacillota bacterium]